MKIGVCGLVCEYCPLFTSKKCPGCRPNEFCPLPACAKEKNVSLCFECNEFPCEKHYESGPIVKELLDHFKKEKQNAND